MIALVLLSAQPGGVCVRVVDGDTLDLWGGAAVVRVRLLGVDCPELHHPNRGTEYYGPEAAAYARAAALGRAVRLTYGPQRRDRYGRAVAYAWVGRRLLNLDLLRAGLAFAWPFSRHPREREFALAENDARRHRRGLWARLAAP